MVDVTLRGGVGARVDAQVEAKRSQFLCRLVRVETEEQARAVIEDARKEHWNAGHHCSAFILGASILPNQVRRSNDDGEPSGTAGMPMLDVLIGRDLIDCVAVVTRYFGGVLLGTGGLARAYSDAVIAAIDDATRLRLIVARERRELFTLAIAHADAGRIEAELRQRGVTILGTDYGERAVLRMAGDNASALDGLIAAATSGAGRLEAIGHEWVDTERGGH